MFLFNITCVKLVKVLFAAIFKAYSVLINALVHLAPIHTGQVYAANKHKVICWYVRTCRYTVYDCTRRYMWVHINILHKCTQAYAQGWI